MNSTAWLHGRLRSHNRHAAALALLALASAALVWLLAYFLFAFLSLGFLSATRGYDGARTPEWIPISALAVLAILLVWGVVDQMRGRFPEMTDRQIVGWHVVGDLLLLPMRLTFSILGNARAIRFLSDAELQRAWELLVWIKKSGKAYLRSLTLVEPDSDRLFRLVTTLQMLDLIDLHRGEGDWFYTVRSTRLEEVGNLLASPGEESIS